MYLKVIKRHSKLVLQFEILNLVNNNNSRILLRESFVN